MTDEKLIRLLRIGEWGGVGDEEMVLAADRIEQLVEERGETHEEAMAAIEMWGAALKGQREAEAKLARAVDALRPFADQAYTFDSGGKEFVPDKFMPAIVTHTIGDLRRARAALAELEDKP